MKNKKNELNYALILPVFILCLIGLLSIYVALFQDNKSESFIRIALLKQGIWMLLGLGIAILFSHISPKFWWNSSPYFYFLCILLLIILLKYHNQYLYEQTGAKNWFSFAGITFQPTEVVKIGFILILARLATTRNLDQTIKADLFLLLKMTLSFIPLIILLLLQNDFGTLLVFLFIYVFIIILSGISWRILLPCISLGIILGIITLLLVTTTNGRELLSLIGFKQYQFHRIDVWLNPFIDVHGTSYQISRGILAIATGGFTGKGFNVSEIFVPVRESDMIFSVIGENFGFVGSSFVIMLYFILIYQIFKICLECNNIFFTYIGTGVVAMLFFHIFENIGSNIALLPLTGIPLPFISQGGSSVLSNFMGLGLILSASKYTDKLGNTRIDYSNNN